MKKRKNVEINKTKKSDMDVKYMRMIILLFFVTTPIGLIAQKLTLCYKGAWDEWREVGTLIAKYRDDSGFILKTRGQIEYFSFRINNYIPPSKKEKKIHRQNNIWFEYQGTVEYYVNDRFPTANDVAKCGVLVMPNPRIDETPCVKRTCMAEIKIAPYKDEPECYNIWFDNIGVGLDVRGLKFDR